MSLLYREKHGNKKLTRAQIRTHFQQPGNIDDEGNIVYFTEQAHKSQCDVNKIIRKYDKTKIITHVSNIEHQYGDVTGIEFKKAQDMVIDAKNKFLELPSDIRKYFKNSPRELLTFMEDENNRDQAIELGLINPSWSEMTDGLGEHVKDGKNTETGEVQKENNNGD